MDQDHEKTAHEPDLINSLQPSSSLSHAPIQDPTTSLPPSTLDQRRASRLTITQSHTATEEPQLSTVHTLVFISTIVASQFLTQWGLAIAIAPLSYIGQSFHTTNPGQLSWLAAGYSLTVGTFILPAGRWGDLYGHKLIFILGWWWFCVWTLIAGLSVYAHSVVFFAFCRAMQGIGPALLLPNAIAIVSRTYPPSSRKKAMALSVFAAAAPCGFVVGAVFAGIFVEVANWWPWCYFQLSILCALFGGLSIFAVPSQPLVGARPKLAELDPFGSVLGVLGLVLFNFGWNEGPAADWPVFAYVLLIVGFLTIVAFIYVETKVSKWPIVPGFAFTRDTSLVLGCIGVAWSSFGILVFYYWQLELHLRHHSVLLTAARSSPAAVTGPIAAILTGLIIGRLQPGIIMMFAMLAFLTGNMLLATTPVHQNYWAQTFLAFVIAPFGMDMSFPSGVIVLSDVMPREHQGTSASLGGCNPLVELRGADCLRSEHNRELQHLHRFR